VFVTTFKILQLLETSSPGPLPGLRPWTPLGIPIPQTPCGFAPHPKPPSAAFVAAYFRMILDQPFATFVIFSIYSCSVLSLGTGSGLQLGLGPRQTAAKYSASVNVYVYCLLLNSNNSMTSVALAEVCALGVPF